MRRHAADVWAVVTGKQSALTDLDDASYLLHELRLPACAPVLDAHLLLTPLLTLLNVIELFFEHRY